MEALLGREIVRQLARPVEDGTLAFLIDLANRDGIQPHRLFDWHAALLDGPLVRAVLK